MTTSLDRATSVAQIVLEHSECAKVFHDHRIDFCCRGELSLTAACAGKGIDVETVVADLERAIGDRMAATERDPRTLSTSELVAHIVSRHHGYLNGALPFLEPLAAKVARVHGAHNPKLLAVLDALRELRATLEPHLVHEERVLFPALTAQAPELAPVAAELASMHEDHLRVGEMLTRLRAHADDYVSPEWACNSYRTLMGELRELELDTLRHVHLENHVLMPRFTPAASAGQVTPEARARTSTLQLREL